jgi:hypothetical protein
LLLLSIIKHICSMVEQQAPREYDDDEERGIEAFIIDLELQDAVISTDDVHDLTNFTLVASGTLLLLSIIKHICSMAEEQAPREYDDDEQRGIEAFNEAPELQEDAVISTHDVHDLRDFKLVASGIPEGEPWGIYESIAEAADEDTYIRVEYNPILRLTTTQPLRNGPGVRLPQNPPTRIEWIHKPTVRVTSFPLLVYDSTVNRSRVLTRANWLFIMASVLGMFRLVSMIVGLIVGGLHRSQFWTVLADVVAGVLARFCFILYAKYPNQGSSIQILFAFLSPLFWCLAYAGSPGPQKGRIWRIPLWLRVAAGLLTVFMNGVVGFEVNSEFFFLLSILGIIVGAIGGSPSFEDMCDEWSHWQSIFVAKNSFVLSACMCHLYATLSHIAYMQMANGRHSLVIGMLAIPALAEAAMLFVVAHRLSTALKRRTLALRYQACAQFGGILAGTLMVCNLHQNLDDMITIETPGNPRGEDKYCERNYVTWTVRGASETRRYGANGSWESAGILLPGPWAGSKVRQQDIAYTLGREEGDPLIVATVLSLTPTNIPAYLGDMTGYGNTAITLGRTLSVALGRTLSVAAPDYRPDERPTTLYGKRDKWFIRGVGGGLIGLPII